MALAHCACVYVYMCVCRSYSFTGWHARAVSLLFGLSYIFFGCIKPGNSPRDIGDWLSREEEVGESIDESPVRERRRKEGIWLARDTSSWKYFKGKGVESKIKYFRKYRKLLLPLARLALTDCTANLPFLKPRQSTTKANKLAGSCKPKFLASASIIIPTSPPGRDETRARIIFRCGYVRVYVCTYVSPLLFPPLPRMRHFQKRS